MELKRIGLVLPGGGSRGAYQLGVLLALKKYRLLDNVVAIGGASIGSFMSVLYHQNDLAETYRAWKNITQDVVLGYKEAMKEKIPIKTQGMFSRNQLISYINHNFDLHELMNNNIPTYASAARVNKRLFKKSTYSREYFLLNGKSHEQILSFLLASSAIPLIFDQVTIKGHSYVDALKADNEPVHPLLNYNLDSIIVIPLSKTHDALKFKNQNLPVIDFMSPVIEQEPTLDMLDFADKFLDYRLNLGYFNGITLLEELRKRKILGKKNKNELNYYSLNDLNIEIKMTKTYSFEALYKDAEKEVKI